MGKATFMAVFSILLLLLVPGCSEKEPVRFGFVADFTGRASNLAVHGRNAISMAVEEINEQGGIGGHPVSFEYGDHQGDGEVCSEVVDRLISEGSDFIIGPMVSGMARTVIDAAAPSGTLVFGPTVSTDELTGIDDNFIRGVAPASYQGIYLARAVLPYNLNNVVFVMDGRNRAYADALVNGFSREMGEESFSLSIDYLVFNGKEDFPALVEELESIAPDGLIFVASGIDSAGIIQLYAKENEIPRLFGGSWTKVTDIIEYAGNTVEGMVIIDSFANIEPIDRERQFYRKYQAVFGIPPNIAAISTYEVVMFVADAVRKAGSTDGEKVKQAIIDMDEIRGIADTFHIDKYGDGVRNLSTVMIREGEYLILEELNVDL